MSFTLIYDGLVSSVPGAAPGEGDVLLSPAELAASTGWERKPEGLCRAERCVPLSPATAAEFFPEDGRFNLSAFARYLEQPVVHDAAAAVWSFGESAAVRSGALRSLEAPGFRLPDLDGRMHALSDYHGKKVLLLSWASW